VQWVGRYSPSGDPESPWYPCAVLNVSRDGAGLELLGGHPVSVDDPIVLDIERIGPTPVMLRLNGVTRYVGGRTPEGALNIGVKLRFDGSQGERTERFLFADER
jgi:hypothetical protein